MDPTPFLLAYLRDTHLLIVGGAMAYPMIRGAVEGIGLAWAIQCRVWRSVSKLGAVVAILAGLGTSLVSLVSKWRDWVYLVQSSKAKGHFDLRTHQERAQPDRVVIWVHGTWSKSAANRGPEMDLLRSVMAEFPDATVQSFDWRAPNRLAWRARAATELAALCSARQAKDVPLVLLGHSYGGRVAYDAAAILQSAYKVRAITLATPFVDLIGLRSTHGRAAFHASLGFYLYLGSAIGILIWYLVRPLELDLWAPLHLTYTSPQDVALVRTATAITISGSLACFILWVVLAQLRARLASEVARHGTRHDGLAPNQSIHIRCANDPLLNGISTSYRLQAVRLRTALMHYRKESEGSAHESNPWISDAAKFVAVLAFAFTAKYVFVPTASAGLERNLPIQTVAWLAVTMTMIVPTAFTLAFPMRVFIYLGQGASLLIRNLWPVGMLVSIAQAQLSGLPVLYLLAGHVRIGDAPQGRKALPAKESAITRAANLLARHTQMLREPDVIRQVLDACRR